MLTLLLALAAAFAPDSPDSTFAAQVRARVQQDSTAKVAVAYWRLAGDDSLFVHDNWNFHAASTMKVPVMTQLFRMVDAGTLSAIAGACRDQEEMRFRYQSRDGSPSTHVLQVSPQYPL